MPSHDKPCFSPSAMSVDDAHQACHPNSPYTNSCNPIGDRHPCPLTTSPAFRPLPCRLTTLTRLAIPIHPTRILAILSEIDIHALSRQALLFALCHVG